MFADVKRNFAIIFNMEIAKGKSVSQRDIAREAGLCIATVSRVLTGKADRLGGVTPETCRKVREAAARLGYRLNVAGRMLRLGKSNAVGLLFSAESALYMELLGHLQRELFRRGFVAIAGLWHNNDDVGQTISAVAAHGVDGLIVCHDPEPVRRLAGDIPVVHFITGDALTDSVTVGAMHATLLRHLAECGHRRIVLFGPYGEDDVPAMEVAREFGLSLTFAHCCAGRCAPPMRTRLIGALDLFGSPGRSAGPTALLCPTDDSAALAIAALTRRGIRVPEDVSVGSAESLAFGADFFPPITGTVIDLPLLARTLVDTLFSRMENPSAPPVHIEMPLTVARRESVATVQ